MTRFGKRKISRPGIVLLILVLLFLVPLSVAWLLYDKQNLLSGKTTNRGDLIIPPLPISTITNDISQTLNNTNRTDHKKIAKGKWLVMLLEPKQCDQTCQKNLYSIRQICLATGKESSRVERILLTYQGEKNDTTLKRLIQKKYPGTRLLITKKQSFMQIIKTRVHQDYALKAGTIYLVDPLGNVMMSYKPGTNPSSIYKDLKRLLKVSQIG